MPSPAVTAEAAAIHEADAQEYRRGLLLGVTAYGLWGLFPLYWPLVRPAGAFEILAHRMLWSLVTMAAVLWWLRKRHRGGGGFAAVWALVTNRRTLALLSAAAVLITANWGTYIWAVNSGHVVETALGYFIGPLVSVLVGVVLLHERLRRTQWVAVGLGGVAVVVLTAGYGGLPWVALILAFSFGTYGLCKKLAGAGAAESLTVETAITSVPALVYLGVLQAHGASTLTGHGVGHAVLLAGSGVITAIPLLAFGGAATRIPLSVIGLLQYIAPVMQFLLGILVFHEQMPPARWAGFALVWLGLAILTWDGTRRRTPATQRPAPAA